GEPVLFGDVDRDADEMRPALAGLIDEFTARAQPDPGAVVMPHSERMVDEAGAGINQLIDEIVRLQVVGMDESVDLGEGEQLFACRKSENGEHRMRPEDAPARDIPVPQATAAAVEGGIDTGMHRLVEGVSFTGSGRLPM